MAGPDCYVQEGYWDDCYTGTPYVVDGYWQDNNYADLECDCQGKEPEQTESVGGGHGYWGNRRRRRRYDKKTPFVDQYAVNRLRDELADERRRLKRAQDRREALKDRDRQRKARISAIQANRAALATDAKAAAELRLLRLQEAEEAAFIDEINAAIEAGMPIIEEIAADLDLATDGRLHNQNLALILTTTLY